MMRRGGLGAKEIPKERQAGNTRVHQTAVNGPTHLRRLSGWGRGQGVEEDKKKKKHGQAKTGIKRQYKKQLQKLRAGKKKKTYQPVVLL
jgi:hypothetical protein